MTKCPDCGHRSLHFPVINPSRGKTESYCDECKGGKCSPK